MSESGRRVLDLIDDAELLSRARESSRAWLRGSDFARSFFEFDHFWNEYDLDNVIVHPSAIEELAAVRSTFKKRARPGPYNTIPWDTESVLGASMWLLASGRRGGFTYRAELQWSPIAMIGRPQPASAWVFDRDGGDVRLLALRPHRLDRLVEPEEFATQLLFHACSRLGPYAVAQLAGSLPEHPEDVRDTPFAGTLTKVLRASDEELRGDEKATLRGSIAISTVIGAIPSDLVVPQIWRTRDTATESLPLEIVARSVQACLLDVVGVV